MNILVLCTHNSARSQMAEGWLNHWCHAMGYHHNIWSAGSEATLVKPQAIATMAEVGIDISKHTSKSLTMLPENLDIDVVWTVCDHVQQVCPVYPVRINKVHISFDDPTHLGEDKWRSVRDEIGVAAKQFLINLV